VNTKETCRGNCLFKTKDVEETENLTNEAEAKRY